MLKRLINEARFDLTITTTSPLLVRSGHATLSGPDMTPVLTYRDGERQVYIPGSSLKGVIRGHVEKVSRTIRDGVVCDPFHKVDDHQGDAFCGDRFQARSKANQKIDSCTAYRDACPVCRLFGSTSFIGRVSINDAYLTEWHDINPTEIRDGVGIDRLTGGAAKHAKFDLEVVASGTEFSTTVYLRNFEVWQLGMIMMVVQDMEDGLLKIGSGKSRGLGSFEAAISKVEISSPLPLVRDMPSDQIRGLGKLQSAEEQEAYGTLSDDVLKVNPIPEVVVRGIRQQKTFKTASLDSLKSESIMRYVERLGDWQVPEAMQVEALHRQGATANG